MLLGNKQIFFNHDYAYEIMEKTENLGPRTYSNTEESARELRVQGIKVATMRVNLDPSIEEKICNAFSWKQVDNKVKGLQTDSQARHKLKEFISSNNLSKRR